MWFVIAAVLGYVAYSRLANKESGAPKLGGGKDVAIAGEDARFEAALDSLLADPLSKMMGEHSPDEMKEEARTTWYSDDPNEIAALGAEVRLAPMVFKSMLESSKEPGAGASPFIPGAEAALPGFREKAIAFSKICRDKIERLTAQGAILDAAFAKIDSGSFELSTEAPPPEFARVAMIDKAARSPLVFTPTSPAGFTKLEDWTSDYPMYKGNLSATKTGKVIGEATVAVYRPVGLIDGQQVSIGRVVDFKPKGTLIEFREVAPEGSYFGKGTNIYVLGIGSIELGGIGSA